MCGINGLFNRRPSPEEDLQRVAKMNAVLAHRGPDAFAAWQDASHTVTFGHRRLSILDLSPTGHQPMSSRSGRYTITFNGEIYNFRRLRDQLERLGAKWKGSSDTEVLLEGFEQWGIESTLTQAHGMFALAIWDHKDRTLILVRDRMGEKPLYYSFGSEGALIFSSELKTLAAVNWPRELNREALSLYFRHAYIPAPFTIYKDVLKLKPGHLLRVSLDDLAQGHRPEPTPYWQLKDFVKASPKTLPMEQAKRELRAHLERVIADQMVADVPVGCFLSGGVDSSLITAVMQSLSRRPVKTFTIGFTEAEYNEANHASKVAQHLGTEHTELYVTPEDARAVIPKLSQIYDEPFADSSQIPTYLVSRLAREHVTVSLSGDAGDELFAGYNRYTAVGGVWNKLERLPRGLRSSLGATLGRLSPERLSQLYALAAPVLPSHLRFSQPGEKLAKGLAALKARDSFDLYERLITHWSDGLVLGANDMDRFIVGQADGMEFADPVQALQYIDAITYLPDDILCKVDRAAMAVSLETRVPLLDHQLVEWAFGLPTEVKSSGGVSKRVLRELLYDFVPKSLIERPKQGFGVPIGDWLRGPLKDWADDLLSPERLRRQELLEPEPIQSKWREHLNHTRDWTHHLWDVLMFQQWYEHTR